MSVATVDPADVIRLIIQHLRESGLERAARVLQEDAGISFNTVTSKDAIRADVLAGRWDAVLTHVGRLSLPMETLMDLYEHVVRELLELREDEAALQMLGNTTPLFTMRRDAPARFATLDRSARGGFFDPSTLYGGVSITRERRRAELADAILEEIEDVEAGRLLQVLGEAIKWRASTRRLKLVRGVSGGVQVTRADLLGLGPKRRRPADEQCPARAAGLLKLGKETWANACAFLPDGSGVVTASSDGLLEVWDPWSRRLRQDLPYQAKDATVAAPSHSCAVTAVSVSRDGEMIASGDAEGGVKVWRTSTGTCLVRFRGVHTASVCALSFSADGSLLASGSTDQNAHVLGLKAGAALTSLPGHSGFVNDVAFVDDRVVTACADGKVRVFTAKNGECLASVLPAGSSVGAADTPLLAVCPVPKFHSDLVLAIPRASAAYLLQLPSGRPVLTLSVTGHVTAAHVADDADPSLSSAAASSSGTSWRVHDADEIAPLHATTTTTAAAAAHTTSSGSSGAPSASAAAGSSEASKAAAARAAASAGGGGGASAQVFVAGTLSALGRWALLATNHGRLLAFDLVARRLERTVAVSESERDIVLPPEVLCVRMHPLDNIVATCAREPSVRLWTP